MLIVNETQVIVDIVPELMLHIMLPSDWGVVAIIIVMAVIATFTLVVCITITTCGCPVAPNCCGQAWVIRVKVGAGSWTQWDKCPTQLLQPHEPDEVL
jgi:hypothetical protein